LSSSGKTLPKNKCWHKTSEIVRKSAVNGVLPLLSHKTFFCAQEINNKLIKRDTQK
jgi:hypothetical protein